MKRSKVRGPADAHATTSRLLDTAERLFGKHGYDGIGMRALALKARVNLGAATYHYGSKKALYIEAFMRRFRPSNAEQLRLLRQAQAHGRALSVDEVVDCMARPAYAMGVAHPSFSALLARNLIAPPVFMHAALQREVGVTVQEYVGALHRCLPGVPEEPLRARVMFAMGSVMMFCANIARLPPMRRRVPLEPVFQELARFVVAGLQAPPAGTAVPRVDAVARRRAAALSSAPLP
ncbi:MAG TPA: TetR/AcrR family transcriptional regulator [Steroidobacteraceae bacterium]|jgi:AcrR family transcriptional regulator|nr:TetR/AcrR family transcriptional regulator [Steroidobacteraceae bacterium]